MKEMFLDVVKRTRQDGGREWWNDGRIVPQYSNIPIFQHSIFNDFRQYVATFIYIMENPVLAKITKRSEDFEYNGISFMKKGWYEVVNPPDPAILLLIPGKRQRWLRP